LTPFRSARLTSTLPKDVSFPILSLSNTSILKVENEE
jgi:hypothetical protein